MLKKSIAIFFLSFGLVAQLLAQKNFTMDEAVLGLYTNLRIEDIPQLGFQAQTNNLTKVVGNGETPAYVVVKPNQTVDTVLRLSELKTVISTAKNIPAIQWINKNQYYFTVANKFYKANWDGSKSTISLWREIDENASEQKVSADGSLLTYCIQNNLWVVDKNGIAKAITQEKNENVISGQSVHRNEFGIETGTFISPQSHFVAFYQMDQSMVKDYPIIDWSETPAVNKNIKYPMAGGTTHEVKLGVYNVANGQTIFLATPQPLKNYYLTCVTWSPDERYIFVGVLTRDQRHLQLIQYDAKTGAAVKTLFREDDDKYVEPQHALYFLPGGKTFLWWSQRDGYMHLYRYNLDGEMLNAVTYGDWVVKSIEGINAKTQELIITNTKDDPRSTSIYAVNYITGKMRPLSRVEGTHSALVSDNGRMVIDKYRNEQTPLQINLLDIEDKAYEVLLQAKNPLAGYQLPEVRNVELSADDGTKLYGKLILPHNFDPNKKYPVIYYLYNGPHVQLITNSFPASGNLWYDYLTQQGFIVFSMDGRGSANRGLKFEQAIHNHLGTVEMNDHLVGVSYLKTLPFVDGDRLGLHGWSYGGFMTTSFMTRHPGVFKAAVAGGPVIDWNMYEIMYTERYMSSPSENTTGYEENNLLNHAKDLKGKLMLIHGTDDDVVVWQHSLKFIKKCVDERVQVDYFVYPGHPHNVRGKDRVHLMQKITDYFIQNL